MVETIVTAPEAPTPQATTEPAQPSSLKEKLSGRKTVRAEAHGTLKSISLSVDGVTVTGETGIEQLKHDARMNVENTESWETNWRANKMDRAAIRAERTEQGNTLNRQATRSTEQQRVPSENSR